MKKLLWFLDSDVEIQKAVKSSISNVSADYEIEAFGSPILIDEKLKEKTPKVIFIDLPIASQDNSALVRELKSNTATKNIAVILMAPGTHVEEKAIAMGMDGSLPKPFDMKEFVRVAEEYSEQKKKEP